MNRSAGAHSDRSSMDSLGSEDEFHYYRQRQRKRRRVDRALYDNDDDDDDDGDDGDEGDDGAEDVSAVSTEDGYFDSLEDELEQALITTPGPNHVDPILVPSPGSSSPLEPGHSAAENEVIELGEHSEPESAREASTIGSNPEPTEIPESPEALEILDHGPSPSPSQPPAPSTPIPRSEHKRACDYKCPICFEPPEAALFTPCGHIFCTECLFQMLNSTRTNRKAGQCALCRRDVKLKEVRLLILRKKRIPKSA
ncbi:LADA_0H09494g1_1 [Lachancea dasiensis]|uniref:LADA_0H09494g1_1 n=1 Tax=Lachancea dasiensis TaxID=1072105 RepID=A0A1G4K2T8_9SACH|nr:LADA_0H09494g1_1 [Lachancea dasiensis]